MSSFSVPFTHAVKQHPKQSPAIELGFFVCATFFHVSNRGAMNPKPRQVRGFFVCGDSCDPRPGRSLLGNILDAPGRRWGGYENTGSSRRPLPRRSPGRARG